MTTMTAAASALRRYSGLCSQKYPGMRGGPVHTQQYQRPPRKWQANLHLDDRSGAGGHHAQVVVWCGTDGAIRVEAESRRCARTGYRLGASPDLLAWGERVAAAVRRDLGLPDPVGATATAQHGPPKAARALREQARATAEAQAAADYADFIDMFGGE